MPYQEAPRENLNPFVTPDAHILVPKAPGILITPAFDQFFRTHKKMMWDLTKVPFGEINRGLVTEEDISGVRAAMLIESHNPVYTEVLLHMFRQDHEMAAFVVTWSYEELQHYMALRTYLEVSGMINPEELEKQLVQTRSGQWGADESQFTVAQSYAYTMLQEQVTGQFYQKFAANTKEPILQETLTLIGKDEFRHCQWYFRKAQQTLKNTPQAIDEVEDVLLHFRMPGPSFIEDYDLQGAALRQVAHPGAGDLKQALSKVREFIGWRRFMKLATHPAYLRKLGEEWNMDPRKALGLA